jgi:hypothetical protein
MLPIAGSSTPTQTGVKNRSLSSFFGWAGVGGMLSEMVMSLALSVRPEEDVVLIA